MSIYNPPSKTQGVFNPSNFGGLGSGGQITTDYLDANYIQFPVSQGNTTLVGTSVLGDITQQGDFYTTGDLIVNDVNIITEIGTKQDTIGDGDLTIANTNGLQSALNDKQDTIEDGDLTIANTNGLQSALNDKQDTIEDGDLTIAKTDGLQPALNDKQDTIEDGDLTIAKTDGLQTALNGKQDTISNFEVNGNVNFNTSGTNFDTIVVRRPSNTTGLTDDYLIDLNELQIWVNNANILVENADSLITNVVSWSNKDIDLGFQQSPTNLYSGLIENGDGVLTLDPSPTDIAIIIKNIPTSKINDIHAVQIYNIVSTTLGNRAIGLAIELYNSKNDPDLNTILAQSNEILLRDSVYRFDFPSITTYTLGYNIQGILPDSGAYVNLVTLEVVTPFSFPFNITGNMDVSGSITLPTIGDVETTIQGKQDTIEDGDLTIANTSGLQTALDDKQDEITTDTDLTLNSMTTDALIVNHSLSVDTRKYFDTIVLRRPTGITGEAGDFYIALRELQVWIDGSNILQSSGLTSLFANWAVDKEVDLGALGGGSLNDASKLYDNVISNEYDAHSKEGNSTSDIALIIKGLSLNLIETIQAIVLYNRTGTFNNTTIGLAIEVYNSTQDPTLTEILANTRVITNAVDVYRFDFPDIATYTGFATGESLTNIIREEDATSEVVSVAESPTEMVGGLMVNTITLPTIGDVETAIQGKQDTIEDGDLTIANTSGLQTALDNKYDDTGGSIGGNVSITGDLVVVTTIMDEIVTTNIITEIGTKQDSIQDGDLTIAKTSGLQTALDNKYDDTGGTINGNVDISGDLVVGTTNIITELGTKQDEITTDTDLSYNSLTLKQLSVNEDFFNTIVIRRPNLNYGNPSPAILLRELQCWVNDTNILFTNSSTLNTFYASWLEKDVEGIDESYPATRIHDNNIVSSGFETSGQIGGDNTSIIIKDIPLTAIKDIQSLVLYNRNDYYRTRAEGLAIELYNTNNDPNLETPLSSTNVITETRDVYRYDFSAIDTYPSGDFSDTDSTTNIASETLALKEVVSEYADSANITGGLTCDTLTLTGTQINFNSDSFISDTAGSDSGNHLVVFVNGTEYRIKLENAS